MVLIFCIHFKRFYFSERVQDLICQTFLCPDLLQVLVRNVALFYKAANLERISATAFQL